MILKTLRLLVKIMASVSAHEAQVVALDIKEGICLN